MDTSAYRYVYVQDKVNATLKEVTDRQDFFLDNITL